MSDAMLWQLTSFRRGVLLGVSAFIVMVATACTYGTTIPTRTTDTIETTSVVVEAVFPEYDLESFASINPNPDIRVLDLKIDLPFYERERIPRDAINPVYTPKFVSSDDASLRPDEIVMGLEINGDARAYPMGIMRI